MWQDETSLAKSDGIEFWIPKWGRVVGPRVLTGQFDWMYHEVLNKVSLSILSIYK